MVNRVLQKGFGAGEITSSLFARSDLDQYAMGATKIENFVVLPQGAMRTRAGFRFVGEALNSVYPVKLFPFRYSSEQTYILEFGHYTLRFITNGSYLTNPNGSIYTIQSPYSANDLKNIDYSQNADVLTLTNPDYPPMELRRYGTLDWRFVNVRVDPSLPAPTGVWAEAIYASYMTDAENRSKDKLMVFYVVTAVDRDNRESTASSICTGRGNYYISGCKIRLHWNGVSGAVYYRVYREVAGIYAYVGETENTYLDDIGNNPDTTSTPPKFTDIFTQTAGGTITSITINNSGSGYYYGLYNYVYSLPRVVTVGAIPPLMSAECDTEDGTEITSFNPTARLEVVSAATGEIYNNPNRTTLDITTTIKSYVVNGVTKYRKIAYLNTSKDIVLTTSSLEIDRALLRLVLNNSGGVINYNNDFEELAIANSYQDNTQFTNFCDGTGVQIAVFRSLFEQNNTTVQIDLLISSDSGSGASAYVICNNGSISSVTITSKGSGYSSASISVRSTTGSDAVFTPVIATSTVSDYPSSVAQYDQRRVFAGSYNNPLRVWFSNAGFQDLMIYHQPTLDDDRIIITAVTSDADRIRHIVALDSLLLMTGSSELRVFTQNSDALTPSSIAVRAQSYVGANNVQPVIVNNLIVYAAMRGGHVRNLGYDYQQSGYVTQDISVRAPHLFDGKEIRSLTLVKAPIQIIWAVSSDGKLLGCSFLPEQGQIAWHRHTTKDGIFEDVCAISEGTEDHVYAVINRDGRRYIERADDFMATKNDEYYRYLDSYLDGVFQTAQSSISGLDHLEGKEVAVFVDGKQQTNKTVRQGAIFLDSPGRNIAIGLPITCDFISVPLIANYEAELQGRTKNVTSVSLRTSYHGDLSARNYPRGNFYLCKKEDPYLELENKDDSHLIKVSVDGEWTEQSQLEVVHKGVLPVEIQSIVLNTSYEDGK